jgi:hypothetical protein
MYTKLVCLPAVYEQETGQGTKNVAACVFGFSEFFLLRLIGCWSHAQTMKADDARAADMFNRKNNAVCALSPAVFSRSQRSVQEGGQLPQSAGKRQQGSGAALQSHFAVLY